MIAEGQLSRKRGGKRMREPRPLAWMGEAIHRRQAESARTISTYPGCVSKDDLTRNTARRYPHIPRMRALISMRGEPTEAAVELSAGARGQAPQSNRSRISAGMNRLRAA